MRYYDKYRLAQNLFMIVNLCGFAITLFVVIHFVRKFW